ncbi:MAG: 3-phosphoshikimate 1-carboxyvinyltransferase, partial [Elusimicrobiota bacterium]
GDFSSAAFFLTAGLLLKDSEVEVKNVGLNIRRIGFLQVLSKMGAKFSIKNLPPLCNEPVGDVIIKSSHLHGIAFDPQIIPLMIDELPLLALVATQSEGKTVISGAEELRVKESDRIKTVVEGLVKMGAKIDEMPDGMIIEGPVKLKGAKVESYKDHRIAMALAVAGLVAEGETVIEDSECVDISFPGFWEMLHG